MNLSKLQNNKGYYIYRERDKNNSIQLVQLLANMQLLIHYLLTESLLLRKLHGLHRSLGQLTGKHTHPFLYPPKPSAPLPYPHP